MTVRQALAQGEVLSFLNKAYPGQHKKVEANEHSFPCSTCGEQSSCSINLITGQWFCHRASCDGKGNLYSLKTSLGMAHRITVKDGATAEEYAQERLAVAMSRRHKHRMEIWNNVLLTDGRAAKALHYLYGRGIKQGVLESNLIGWIPGPPPGKDGKRWKVATEGRGSSGMISIPYFQNGSKKPVNIKLRWVPPEPQIKRGDKLKTLRYQRVSGGESLLYTPTGIKPKVPLLLVGGEIDALSVLQAVVNCGLDPTNAEECGFQVVSVPNGEGAWDPIFGEQVKDVEDIVIALDSDSAGIIGSHKLAKHIGKYRCKIAHWPGGYKDASQALEEGKLDIFDIQTMIQSGKPVASEGIMSAVGYARRLRARLTSTTPKGYPTGIACLDELIGGFRAGETTILTGHSGSGKSTLASQLTLFQVLANGLKSFVGAFEGGPMPFLEKVLRQCNGIDPFLLEMDTVDYTLGKVSNMYVLDHSGSIDTAAFKETLTYCVERLGVKWVLLDHLHFMVPRQDPDIWSRIGELVMVIQEVISRSDAHCLLLAHPSKNTMASKNRDDYIVQMSDLKGNTSTFQDTPNALSLYRKRTATRQEGDDSENTNIFEAALISLKQRHESGREGRVELAFHKQAALYTGTKIKDPGLMFARKGPTNVTASPTK